VACNNYLIDLPRVNFFVALGLTASFAPNPVLTHTATAESKPFHWLFAGKAAAALALNADASGLLDGTEPFVFSGLTFKDLPPGWKAIPIGAFKSLGDVRNALADNTLASQVRGIMYDYEKWRFTPEEEQKNPARYVKQAAGIVHAYGLLFFTAPAVDLAPVQAPNSDRKHQDETYLRVGIAADAARYADVFVIQSQRFELDTTLYARFVKEAAAQARQANPKIIVIAGVSTQPSGQHVTANDILQAIDATRNFVDGYWLNIPGPSEYSPRVTEFRPDIAVDVLRGLARQ
jgi:hypothetical protein